VWEIIVKWSGLYSLCNTALTFASSVTLLFV
jgi:hypothetical protein